MKILAVVHDRSRYQLDEMCSPVTSAAAKAKRAATPAMMEERIVAVGID